MHHCRSNPGSSFTNLILFLVPLIFLLAGCSAQKGGEAGETTSGGTLLDFATSEEESQLKAALPFYEAMAGRDYDTAYDLLSKWAKHDFVLGRIGIWGLEDDEENSKVELTREKFVELMKRFEEKTAIPDNVDEMYVETMDTDILTGGGDAFDRMMSIGAMPESIPMEIRKSAIRGHVVGTLSEADLKKFKEEEPEATEADLQEAYEPWLMLKCVMVEDPDEGELRVGYFEFFFDSD